MKIAAPATSANFGGARLHARRAWTRSALHELPDLRAWFSTARVAPREAPAWPGYCSPCHPGDSPRAIGTAASESHAGYTIDAISSAGSDSSSHPPRRFQRCRG